MDPVQMEHSMPVQYIRLIDGDSFADLQALRPFKAVVISEAVTSRDFKNSVSEWMVRAGCIYMMAWGKECSVWHDTVDEANLAMFDFGDVPVDAFVMTTWHDNDPLSEVFWYAKFAAKHPTLNIRNTVLVHIGSKDHCARLLDEYQRVA
jgi:hypothetical protein